MNNRLIELIKNPDLLALNDIEILEKEILRNPSAQSFRALQLLATHRFNEKLYPEKLSETAAFTTDKKILYQLIHQKENGENINLEEKESDQQNKSGVLETEKEDDKLPVSKVEKLISIPAAKFQEVELKPIELPKPVHIEGELNRILFEGEENFLNEETEIIDLEASQESGILVIASPDGDSGEFANQNSEQDQSVNAKEEASQNDLQNDSEKIEMEIPIDNLEEATRNFTTETIINEDKIESEEGVIEQFSQLSFHGIDGKLIPDNTSENNLAEAESDNPEPNLEETSRKFTTEAIINEEKINAEEKVVENPAQLSFHGSDEFLPDFKIQVKNEGISNFKAENKASKHEQEMQKLIAEVNAKMKRTTKKIEDKEDEPESSHTLDFTGISHEEKEKVVEKSEKPETLDEVEIATNWKPMSFETQSTRFSNSQKESVENNDNSEIEVLNEKKAIGTYLKQEEEEKVSPKESPAETEQNAEVSNVPTFIDTWQSWLKLGTEIKSKNEDVKQKAIENFIERAPRISKLKEESNFTVKDRGDNISHLMTETLANLYLDQKLYAKAQKAFELLIEKEPEKTEKFQDKLAEIKQVRNQK